MTPSAGPVDSVQSLLPAHLHDALRLLLVGWDYAERSQRDVWDFAVALVLLRTLGLRKDDIRFLVDNGYVQGPAGGQRSFVLTAAGVAAARSILAHNLSNPLELPHYDGELHELTVGRQLVKRFEQPAPDQELILTAFEEEHWRFRIWNPLFPRHDSDDTKIRLNRAIYRLNRHQVNQLIHFRGDGTAKGAIWEPWGSWRNVR